MLDFLAQSWKLADIKLADECELIAARIHHRPSDHTQ
jgi:hypothetical protein